VCSIFCVLYNDDGVLDGHSVKLLCHHFKPWDMWDVMSSLYVLSTCWLDMRTALTGCRVTFPPTEHVSFLVQCAVCISAIQKHF